MAVAIKQEEGPPTWEETKRVYEQAAQHIIAFAKKYGLLGLYWDYT